MKLGKQKGLV